MTKLATSYVSPKLMEILQTIKNSQEVCEFEWNPDKNRIEVRFKHGAFKRMGLAAYNCVYLNAALNRLIRKYVLINHNVEFILKDGLKLTDDNKEEMLIALRNYDPHKGRTGAWKKRDTPPY